LPSFKAANRGGDQHRDILLLYAVQVTNKLLRTPDALVRLLDYRGDVIMALTRMRAGGHGMQHGRDFGIGADPRTE
jgi:hypothetical protein